MNNFIEFTFNQEIYKIGLFNKKSENKVSIKNENINDIYYKCFNSKTSISALNNLSNSLAFNLVIFNNDNKLIFISTIIPNPDTKNIEIYNICKDLDSKNFSSSLFIRKFIEIFLRPIFYPLYKKIVLSILLDNKYIIPTILCYLNIGFYLLKDDTRMMAVNQPHFKMYLNLKNPVKLNKYQKIIIFFYILYFYFWDISKLKVIYSNLIGKRPNVNSIYKLSDKIIIYLIYNYEL